MACALVPSSEMVAHDGAKRRILIVTDAWHPQINGVVRTLAATGKELMRAGHQVEMHTPADYLTMPCPLYPEIKLALFPRRRLSAILTAFKPHHIHIATEGPIGLRARSFCLRHGLRFSTSFHTHFAKYLKHLAAVPTWVTWRYLRWFHGAAEHIMTATPSLEEELRSHGLTRLCRWQRGVDHEIFYPYPKTTASDRRPVLLFVGRISKEKNIDAFLRLSVPGTKRVVGDGPYRAQLQKRYPEVEFLGYRRGVDLAQAFSDADVFVFPSLTDTFGVVVLEALACGVPVAAFPAQGPKDILTSPETGCCDKDLGRAVEAALRTGSREACCALAKQYTWEAAAGQFFNNLVPAVSTV
mgnify:CR=1 FL=1